MQHEMGGGQSKAAAPLPKAAPRKKEINLDEVHRMAAASAHDGDIEVELTEEDMNDPDLLVCALYFFLPLSFLIFSSFLLLISRF